MSHAMRESVGLAGSGACNNEQRGRVFDAVLDGTTLLGIKRGKVWCHHEEAVPNHQSTSKHGFFGLRKWGSD
jgi:hypothetical protein